MKYKRNIFGRVVPVDEKQKNTVRNFLDKNENARIASQLLELNFLAGVFFVWEVIFLAGEIFGIELKFTGEKRFPGIFLFVVLPLLSGCFRIAVLDSFLDTFSWKIKWWFTFLTFMGIAGIIFYAKHTAQA